jgi:sulfane dehydrogenase subunit SoxC
LLDRRALLGRGVILAGAIGSAPLGSLTGAAAEPLTDAQAADAPLTDPPWSLEPGAAIGPYERPSRFEKSVVRTVANPDRLPGAQGARTPHHLLNGAITPNGLHFVVSWGGAPDIDPDKHRLVIHGLVKRPLVFTLDALARYPMTTRVTFLECGGNSGPLFSPQPLQADLQALHGLASCAEWTGVKLSTLLDEAGVPLKKGLDDAMIALYQNGERLMPANGYPMRLLLPGYEGNMNVKYLRRIKLVEEPAMSYWESKIYAPILPNGKAYQFYLLQEVKSFITQPSPGVNLKGPGLYEISGIAYSGAGRITKVMVSADGGKSWAEAGLSEPVLSKAFTRFRMPWRWEGGPATLQSRAWDDAGNVQPTRAEFVAQRGELKAVPPVGAVLNHHFNAVTSWGVDGTGELKHVYP